MKASSPCAARDRVALSLVLVLALALRLGNAAWGSLKLDDFHSLHHARAAGMAEFFSVLRQDNHPPLAFLLVKLARALGGESPWALRMPALLAGLGTLLLVWRIGARLSTRPARIAATFLLAVSSLHVELSSDVRMYALLALASAGSLEGLLACFEDGRGAWRITLWTVVGLHTHYHFLYTLAALGGTAVVLGLRAAERRAALRRALAAFSCAGLLAAPWYLLAFPAQLAHGLAPGGSEATPLRMLEGYKNLVFLNVSVGGATLRAAGLAGSALFLALIAAGVGLLGASAKGSALSPLLLASALGVPALTFGAAQLSGRAGFEWRYLSAILPSVCLLAGEGALAPGRLPAVRRAALGLVAPLALALAVLNARDPGEEDYRGAVAWILEQSREGDAVVAADWQPALFPHALAWSYYAPRAAGARPLPEILAHDATFSLAEPGRLETYARVFCCLRSLPNGCGLLRALRSAFAHEEVHPFGRSVYVHVFTRT